MAWGLLDPADLVSDDLRMVSVAHRNFNVRVERRRGPNLLVKRSWPKGAPRRAVAAEGRFYAFCHDEPRAAPVAACMARLHAAFPEEGALVIELLDGGVDLWRHYRTAFDQKTLPLDAPRGLGRALGTLHSTFRVPDLGDDPRLAELSAEPPHFFRLHRPALALRRWLSGAQLRVLRVVRKDLRISGELEGLARAWRAESLVHGDVRSSNVLVVADADPVVRLVDWELVQRGDPAWDVAGVLGDFLLFWIRNMPPDPDLDAAARVEDAVYPLEAIRPAVRAFWETYRAAAELDAPAAAERMRRGVALSGVRLLQSAWEFADEAERMSSLVVLLLQLSANILTDPRAATSGLYDLVE